MRLSILTLSCAAIFAMCPACATPEILPVKYKVSALEYSGEKKIAKNISIQKVEFESVAGMDQKFVKAINFGLNQTFKNFENEAKKCGGMAQGHPWNYESKFEKVLLSRRYMSVVFSKSTVCAGSPDIEKESRVFSVKNGSLIPAIALAKEVLPSAKISQGVTANKDLVRLDEETAEAMIDDSKTALKNYDEKCEFFLKNTSYRIWVDGKNLVLFPEFVQPNSFCQKEYIIETVE
jgi:hypothetical protein